MSVKLGVLVALSAVAFVPAAQSQVRTTTPTLYVNIHVTLTNSRVVVYPKTAPRGSSARFIVHNTATKPITFSVGSHTPGIGFLFGVRSVIKPNASKVLLLYLSVRGSVPYYEGDSFASAKAATKGKLLVGNTCGQCAPPGPPLPP